VINFNTLIIGLVSLALGTIGVAIKSNMKDYPAKSYSGASFLWSIYLLIGCGILLVISSFF
jgi:hypothetical protein